MKKRILTMLLAVCFIVPCMFILTACGTLGLEGKTYVYDKVEYVFGESVSEEIISAMQEQLESEDDTDTNEYADKSFKFEGNTIVLVDGESEEVSYWKYLDDAKTKIGMYQTEDMEGDPVGVFTIDGEKLVMEMDVSQEAGMDLKIKVFFKEA